MPPKQQERTPLALSAKLLAKARRKRLCGETGTVLMIGANYFVQREVARAFRGHGWKVIMVNVEPAGEYIQKLLETVLFEEPDLLFTVNHFGFDAGGIVSSLIEQVELPAVSWFVDSPAYILLNHLNAVSPWIMAPVWERTEMKTLTDLGFEDPFWLPLGTDPELMGIGREKSKNGLVGFVGNSMVAPCVKWTGKLPTGQDILELLNVAVERILIDRSSDPSGEAIPADWDTLTRLNFASAVVLEATKRYRHESLKSLSNKPLKIWGDDDWRNVAPFGAIIADGVEYYRELPLVYGANSINLNFTSFQMPTAVNQRVFDAPAAGGFLLTDDQGDLHELFQRDETALFSSALELCDKADFYLRHPEKAERIARRAYQRILREHTYFHRIGTILAETKRRFVHKAQFTSLESC